MLQLWKNTQSYGRMLFDWVIVMCPYFSEERVKPSTDGYVKKLIKNNESALQLEVFLDANVGTLIW